MLQTGLLPSLCCPAFLSTLSPSDSLPAGYLLHLWAYRVSSYSFQKKKAVQGRVPHSLLPLSCYADPHTPEDSSLLLHVLSRFRDRTYTG